MAADIIVPPRGARGRYHLIHEAARRRTPAARRAFAVLRRYRVFLFFLFGLVGIDLLLLAARDVWHAYDPDDYRERLHGVRQRPRDLVLVGGSTVSEGIDPRSLTGMSWRGQPLDDIYNLGLPGATTTEVWHGVKHGLTPPPRLLVYGITASDLNDSRNEAHGTRSLMTPGDVAEWVYCRPQSAEWVLRHYFEDRVGDAWQLYRHRNALRLWAADQAEAILPDAFPEARAEAQHNLRCSAELRRGDGFAPQTKIRFAHLDFKKVMNDVPSRFPFLENYRLGGHLLYLNRLLDWAETNGVEVVLLDMPVPADIEERMHPEAFARYRTALTDVARRRRLLLLRAGRRDLGLDDRHFSDLIHLNDSGTRRLGDWLRAALAAAGDRDKEAALSRGTAP